MKHKQIQRANMLIRSSYSGLPVISLMYREGNFSAAKHQRLLREGMRTAPVKL